MKIVIINGTAQTGKTNFAKFFKKHYIYGSINLSTIDYIKKICKKKFGWDGKKTNESRKFLSEMKRIWSEYNNGPFEEITKKIYNHHIKLDVNEKDNFIYLIDCREPNEIQKFVDKYKDDCYTLLLERNDREVPDNDSDRNVKNYKYDYVIHNNGNKDDLELEAVEFIKYLQQKTL